MGKERKNASMEDVQNALMDLAQAQKKTEEEQRKTEKSRREGEERLRKSLDELAQAQKKTEKAQQRTEEAQKKTEEAQQRTEEAQQRTAKAQERTEASIEKVNKAYGSLNNTWGEMTENLVEGNLLSLLQERGFEEVGFVQPRLKFRDNSGRVGEIDLMAINGEDRVAVEVKTSLRKRDVVKFLEQLNIFKNHPPEGYQNKSIYAGVAFFKASKAAIEYAEEEGLFVIKCLGGETKVSTIINSKNFRPRKI